MSFKRLDPEDFIFSAESVTAPAWTTNSPILTSRTNDEGVFSTDFHTSSIQESSITGKYYVAVYQKPSTDVDSEVQFDIAYGNSEGDGEKPFTNGISASYTSTIYGQYQNLVYGDENTNFIFNNVSQSSFYALTIDRSRYKEKLLPGTFNLVLADAQGNPSLRLTDNSKDVGTLSFTEAGRVFQIVSGSDGSAISSEDSVLGAVAPGMTVSGSYGLFLPDIGTIILNAKALDLLPPTDGVNGGGINLGTQTTRIGGENNPGRLFGRINSGSNFQLNSEETITSDFVFVRARNAEFNYSENPSFISGSQGVVIYDSFINNPQTYITTVGLYNDNNDLLAVAKLSKPLKKDFTKETLVRVKLDF
jgi:hypothetical protein